MEGGRENDGTPIYIAQADHYGQQPGKASTKLDGKFTLLHKLSPDSNSPIGAYVVYGNKEERVKVNRLVDFYLSGTNPNYQEYTVLCYA